MTELHHKEAKNIKLHIHKKMGGLEDAQLQII